MKKTLKVLIPALLLIALLGYLFIWRSPATFTLKSSDCELTDAVWTMDQYSVVSSSHPRPFVYQKQAGQGAVFVYGSEHTQNPEDPQIADLSARWQAFEPTVALVEGRLGFLIPGLMDPVKSYGEMGKVAQLAKSSGVSLFSWDVPKSELAQRATGRFDKEQIALSLILNPYFGNLRYGRPEAPEDFAMKFIGRAAMVGLDNSIQNTDDIDRLWSEYFPDGPDWRDTSDQWGLPGFLQDLAHEYNLIRNKQLVCIISELVSQGERVFVACGSSHAVCIQEALSVLSPTSSLPRF